MAAGEEGVGYVRRLVEALQLMRGARAVAARGAWAVQDEARTLVTDFVQVSGLDVMLTELEDGFRVEVRNRPERTVRLDF